MNQYLIMCKSLTYAQRASRLLEDAGFSAAVIKAPLELRGSGCGYSLSIYRRVAEAVALLRKNDLITGKIYRRLENGDYSEVFK